MPLIQGANITSQQFDKMNYILCLTSIFKMGLKWEVPSFRDFPSHTIQIWSPSCVTYKSAGDGMDYGYMHSAHGAQWQRMQQKWYPDTWTWCSPCLKSRSPPPHLISQETHSNLPGSHPQQHGLGWLTMPGSCTPFAPGSRAQPLWMAALRCYHPPDDSRARLC